MRFKFGSLVMVVAMLGLLAGLAPAHADAVFTTRAAFNAAAPGLPLETFESGTVPNGGVIGCNDPISLGNEQGCFTPGTLQPGIEYSGDGANQPGIAEVGAGFAGAPNKVLVANYFTEGFQMDLSPAVHFFGADLVSYFAADTCTVDLFDASGAPIGSHDAACAPGGKFVGFQSDTAIARVVVTAPSGQAEGVNDVAFGNLEDSTTTAHPAVLDTSGPAATLTLSATLTGGGGPVAGQTIHFSIDGTEVCTGTTDAAGNASCGSIPEVLAVAMSSTGTYDAAFGGGGGFAPSSGSAGLIA